MSKQENWVQIDKKLPKGITQTKKASDIETIDQVVGCYKKVRSSTIRCQLNRLRTRNYETIVQKILTS